MLIVSFFFGGGVLVGPVLPFTGDLFICFALIERAFKDFVPGFLSNSK